MVETLYRSVAPDLEVRSGGDGRTIEGIVVPYDVEQRIDATLVETFARGAFTSQLDKPFRVRFAREHVALGGTVIGKATDLREDAAGLYGAFRVSDTAAGAETLTLVRDGVLDEMSIGFRAGRSRRLQNGTVQRTSAHLIEVSVVTAGAYGQHAKVSAVRSAETFLDELVEDELRERAERARRLRAAIPLDRTRVIIG